MASPLATRLVGILLIGILFNATGIATVAGCTSTHADTPASAPSSIAQCAEIYADRAPRYVECARGFGADAEPQFSFRVLPEAISRTTEGLPVQIRADGIRWSAEVDSLAASSDAAGGTVALLRPMSGSTSICAAECAAGVAPGCTADLPGTLVLVAETTGLQVPTAALQIDSSGSIFLTLVDGSTLPVTVRGSRDGRSIVDGAKLGQRMLVVGTFDSGTENTQGQ